MKNVWIHVNVLSMQIATQETTGDIAHAFPILLEIHTAMNAYQFLSL